MAKHSSSKIIIMAAAVLCLFIAVVIALSCAGQVGMTATDSPESPVDRSQDIQTGKAQPEDIQSANTQSHGTQTDKSLSDLNSEAGIGQSSYRSTSRLRCMHYNEKEFLDSVSLAAKTDLEHSPASGQVIGGIVPHHLLAANMIAEFFWTLAQEPPDTLVVVGPNHRRIGFNELHTSTLNWVTPFGVLETDIGLTNNLMEELNASQNDALMELEHSISSLVPYIKYYLPETKIVPILLHGNYSLEDSKKLGEFLSEAMKDDEGIMVIASIDFSHYLDTDTANRMDAITLEAIESRDTLALIRMTNDNLDSPPSILTLLSAMDGVGAVGPDVIGHNNSFGISGTSPDYTTSYYTMLFRR
jgi:AmmeMemoRadiSam system protein B